jgi:hypothetical protein
MFLHYGLIVCKRTLTELVQIDAKPESVQSPQR